MTNQTIANQRTRITIPEVLGHDFQVAVSALTRLYKDPSAAFIAHPSPVFKVDMHANLMLLTQVSIEKSITTQTYKIWMAFMAIETEEARLARVRSRHRWTGQAIVDERTWLYSYDPPEAQEGINVLQVDRVETRSAWRTLQHKLYNHLKHDLGMAHLFEKYAASPYATDAYLETRQPESVPAITTVGTKAIPKRGVS
jgi:hypothetical protein